MHKLCHVAKTNLAKCINIKASMMDDGILFYFILFHFLEMHKFCHMCQCVIGY